MIFEFFLVYIYKTQKSLSSNIYIYIPKKLKNDYRILLGTPITNNVTSQPSLPFSKIAFVTLKNGISNLLLSQ